MTPENAPSPSPRGSSMRPPRPAPTGGTCKQKKDGFGLMEGLEYVRADPLTKMLSGPGFWTRIFCAWHRLQGRQMLISSLLSPLSYYHYYPVDTHQLRRGIRRQRRLTTPLLSTTILLLPSARRYHFGTPLQTYHIRKFTPPFQHRAGMWPFSPPATSCDDFDNYSYHGSPMSGPSYQPTPPVNPHFLSTPISCQPPFPVNHQQLLPPRSSSPRPSPCTSRASSQRTTPYLCRAWLARGPAPLSTSPPVPAPAVAVAAAAPVLVASAHVFGPGAPGVAAPSAADIRQFFLENVHAAATASITKKEEKKMGEGKEEDKDEAADGLLVDVSKWFHTGHLYEDELWERGAEPKATPTTRKAGKSSMGIGEYDLEKIANSRLNKRKGTMWLDQIFHGERRLEQQSRFLDFLSITTLLSTSTLEALAGGCFASKIRRRTDLEAFGSRGTQRPYGLQQDPFPINNTPLLSTSSPSSGGRILSYVSASSAVPGGDSDQVAAHPVMSVWLPSQHALSGPGASCLYWQLVSQRMGRTRSRLRCGVVRIQASKEAVADDDQETPAGLATRGHQAAPKKPVTRSMPAVAGAS
ncbi:hypothetical protein DL766_005722 [Monosporascus sp. MC13-8B]|nr:hypothetical protein DL763_006848 [Monosporascus cannonballus]RYP28763.1 hypothetical protein DL766_005722 [Monosporascus sp. MC13-8B]